MGGGHRVRQRVKGPGIHVRLGTGGLLELQGASQEEQGPPRRSRAWAEGAGTHQAGALETRVGARQEVGPLLVKLPLVLTAWGRGGARMTSWSGESVVDGKA